MGRIIQHTGREAAATGPEQAAHATLWFPSVQRDVGSRPCLSERQPSEGALEPRRMAEMKLLSLAKARHGDLRDVWLMLPCLMEKSFYVSVCTSGL